MKQSPTQSRKRGRPHLYPLHVVEAFERAHTEARDYEAERKLGAAPLLGRRRRTSRGK